MLAVCGTIAVTLAPFATPPAPHRVAGILFGPDFDMRSSVGAISLADPRARLVDARWGGKLVYVTYDDPTFPAALSRAGALYMFDAIAAGCHGPAAGKIATSR